MELIRQKFPENLRLSLDQDLEQAENPYQRAFRFLLGRRGPEVANLVIKESIGFARADLPVESKQPYSFSPNMSDQMCLSFEGDISGWKLPPATEAFGRLAAAYPDIFGRIAITTNFDPLLSVAIEAAGGHAFRSFFHRDGSLSQMGGRGTHIAHLHGYWHGSDTLHTPTQLNQDRPQLRSSLCRIFRENTVVFLGYGGWDDAITKALRDVIDDNSAYPEVAWCFHEAEPSPREDLFQLLRPGIERGRLNVYAGIDCHDALPRLANLLSPQAQPGDRVSVVQEVLKVEAPKQRRVRKWKVLVDDTPPEVDFFVGRDDDVSALKEFPFRAAFITGIGGQGKSALAGHLYNDSSWSGQFDHKIWRDCREHSAPFYDQLLLIIEQLNDGRVSAAQISAQSDESLAQLFCELTEDLRLLIVFDNMDHYVDLEDLSLSGFANKFMAEFVRSKSAATLIFTCRPNVSYDQDGVFSTHLKGLSSRAAIELFALREAPAQEADILSAHEKTKGHPFWLDLLAAQVAKRSPTVTLLELLSEADTETSSIPNQTLRSIWESLRDREQIALQALAETLRPSSTHELSEYLGSRLRFNKLEQAIKYLRGLNLVVVKIQEDRELFELHPVIRAFIVTTFKREQREPFIEAIVAVYDAIFAAYSPTNIAGISQDQVQRYLERIELKLNLRRYDQVLEHLHNLRGRFRTRETPYEFLRLCDRLFEEKGLGPLATDYKFDELFEVYVDLLVNVGRTADASNALEEYQQTLEGKDARYINYCDMQTYLHWRLEEYAVAIRWGQRGVDLKSTTGVDTGFDCSHNLALAQRDSGAIDTALEFFLDGADLSEVIQPGVIQEARNETFYGNIGRCLHLTGQIDPAVTCYKKSGMVMQQAKADASVENKAYLRQWVGELMAAKGDSSFASQALLAAWGNWRIVSPPKANRLEKLADEKLHIELDYEPAAIEKAERAFQRWLSTRSREKS